MATDSPVKKSHLHLQASYGSQHFTISIKKTTEDSEVSSLKYSRILIMWLLFFFFFFTKKHLYFYANVTTDKYRDTKIFSIFLHYNLGPYRNVTQFSHIF